ncbi:MAG TPA: ammonium transporter [Alphaproteobacteria bacterium]|jgi:Amt family ammonium transporter|nr:ammonium transporter [Alphaproteobacteria bacterium]
MSKIFRAGAACAAATAMLVSASDAWAQTVTATFSAGNTAWLLTATALVLFMTLPGLALFYGGLVQSRNVLSVLMHCFAVSAIVSVAWLVAGYALSFGDGGSVNHLIGGLSKAFLAGIGPDTLSGSVPEIAFFMFQMTFAIITPGLIIGAFVERIRFGAVVLFTILWSLFVYVPICHWVWGGGFLANLGVEDFAGGIVVHLTSGISAIIMALMVGPRRKFPVEIHPPHNPGMVMTGAGMLWVGWYGFNGGSALAADGAAAMAIAVTHISAATAACTWMVVEWLRYKRASCVGVVTGAVAGLATVTPASGFIGPFGGFACGLIAGVVCFEAVAFVKHRLKIDDSLDVMAVHGVGGITGTMLTAVLGAPAFGGLGLSKLSIGGQLAAQLIGIAAAAAWTIVATVVIVMVVRATIGLRVSEEDEAEGLDITAHGERAYDLK